MRKLLLFLALVLAVAACTSQPETTTPRSAVYNGSDNSSATPASTGNIDCNAIASRLHGTAMQRDKICSIIITRKDPPIVGTNGQSYNSYISMSSLIELTDQGLPQGQVYVKGELGLLQPELEVLREINNSGWIYNGAQYHMVGENPKVTFVYWEATGDREVVLSQIESVISNTTMTAK